LEFGVDLCKLDIDGFDPGVKLETMSTSAPVGSEERTDVADGALQGGFGSSVFGSEETVHGGSESEREFLVGELSG